MVRNKARIFSRSWEANAIKKERIIRDTRLRRRVKALLITDMKACLESPRETITKLTQIIKGFIRVVEYKLCTQKSIVSIYRKK